MGRIYINLKRIFEKSLDEGNQDIYQSLLDKFVTLLTYENTYLMNKRSVQLILQQSGTDMLINCGGFGITIDKGDNIDIHT